MIKNFNELSKVEVPITKKPIFKFNKAKQKLEEDGSLDTISWVDCLQALYDNGAEKVTFENIPNADGGLLYKDDNGCMHIHIYVDIDGDRRDIYYPLIDGTKVVSADKVTQSDIYNAKQRAFVKCVALNWGLGINIWKKSDNEEQVEKATPDPLSKVFRNLVNAQVKQLGGIPQLVAEIERTSGVIVNDKKIKELISTAETIEKIMYALEAKK